MDSKMILSSTPPRFRSAPTPWQDVVKSIYTDDYDGEPISYDQIQNAALANNLQITRESLRVKLARYKKSGYVKSGPKSGTFWITDKGLRFFGLKEREKKEQTTELPTPSSAWGRKALNIKPADATAR